MRRSQTFAGHVSEAGTLATMLQNLGAPQDALVVMDAGIATEANSQWLRKTGYGYLVVSRERSRHKMRMTLSRSKPLPRNYTLPKSTRRRRARSSALLPLTRP